MPLLLRRSALPNYRLDGKDPIESAVSQMITKWSMTMGNWNGPSMLTMLNLRSSLPLIFRCQCLLPKHRALLLGIYQQALPTAPLSLAPRLQRPPCQPPLLKTLYHRLLSLQPIGSQNQSLLLKILCHRPLPLQPVSSQNWPLFAGDLPDSTPCQVTLTL